MPSRLGRALRRAALIVASLLVVLLIVGAGWEQWSRRRLPSLMPATSRLVDVGGGRRIQLDCRGSGRPTVLFEANLGVYGAQYWSALQDSLATTTRTCAHNRAGLLWSDPAPETYTVDTVTADLHAALTAAGESGPYLLVGYRLGVPLGFRFAAAHPEVVAGAVMIGGFHPEHKTRMGKHLPGYGDLESQFVPKVMAALTWTGFPRLAARGASDDPRIAAMVPTTIRGAIRDAYLFEEILALPPAARDFGDRPLLVLARMNPAEEAALIAQDFEVGAAQVAAADAEFLRMQEDMVRWSTRGRLEVTSRAPNESPETAPGLLAAPIRAMVERLRGDTLVTASR